MGIDTEISMVAVPSGDVTISDRRTQSNWSVQLEPYLLDARPITQAIYSAVGGSGAAGSARTDQRPADSVSWFDAIQFCNALSEPEGLAPAYDAGAQVEHVKWDAQADGWGVPKGHERRSMPIPAFLLEELAAHVAGRDRDDLVFTGVRGGGVLRNRVFRHAGFDRAASPIGLDGLVPHELRHRRRVWR